MASLCLFLKFFCDVLVYPDVRKKNAMLVTYTCRHSAALSMLVRKSLPGLRSINNIERAILARQGQY